MLSKKAKATTPVAPEMMADHNNLNRNYNNLRCKSSRNLKEKVDQLLAGLLICLQYPHLTPPERATVLDSIDGLLRLKIDLRRGTGGCCGC